MEPYKPNNWLYIALLAGSIVITSGSLIIPISSKWFTVIASVGCGGVASVIVAWLIDAMNCIKLNNSHSKLQNDILCQFKQSFNSLLQGLADTCYWYNEDNANDYDTWEYWYDKVFDYSMEENNNEFFKEMCWGITSGLEHIIDSIEEINVQRFDLLDRKITTMETLEKMRKLRSTCIFMNAKLKNWESYERFQNSRNEYKRDISKAIKEITLLQPFQDTNYSANRFD